MIYLSSRLHTSHTIAIDDLLQVFQQLGQAIEFVSTSILRIWQTTHVFSENSIHTRLSDMDGQLPPQTMIAVSSSCYILMEHHDYRTVLTLVSNEKKALESVRSMIANLYEQVQSESLDQFLESNRSLAVQSVKLAEFDSKYNTDYQASLSFGQPVILSTLLDQRASLSSQLLSLSASVDIEAPFVKVRILYINTEEHNVGFAIESGLEEEHNLINSLFRLAEWAFNGKKGNSLIFRTALE